jgi:nitroimidazol reductase NimA-like FMN-containing flavoprotein (pyridoxamine 5'-phosphate oxidase superfamily)
VLGVNAEHYPLIFPVNYGIVAGGILVIRTGPGTKLTAAGHANVTFEVDQIDPYRHTGWSVLVRGLAEEVTDRHRVELAQTTRDSGVEPWAPGEHEHWLRIIPHAVTGRRISQGELLPAFEDAGYL